MSHLTGLHLAPDGGPPSARHYSSSIDNGHPTHRRRTSGFESASR